MREAATSDKKDGGRAHSCASRGGFLCATRKSMFLRKQVPTPLRLLQRANFSGNEPLNLGLRCGATPAFSCSGAWNMSRARRIRENIIGHRMTSFAPLVFDRRRSGFALTMLHEPSREHGRRSFLDPLIHERSHLLAKVRGVAKPREFVGLKTVARCRQQEFPRRLNVVAGGHSVPPE